LHTSITTNPYNKHFIHIIPTPQASYIPTNSQIKNCQSAQKEKEDTDISEIYFQQ